VITMTQNEFHTSAQFETAWDRGVLGILKRAVNLIGHMLIRAGSAICDLTKTPAEKHLEYIFSLEARREAINLAGGEPILIGDIEYEQNVMNSLGGIEKESVAGEESLH
jgi:hypothetical protein